MLVNDGVEGQTVAPGGGEVPDVDVVVAGGLHLAPEQKSILGGPRGCSRSRLFHGDLLDLEPEDDGPDETEGESGVSVDDVVSAHVLEVDPLLVQEGERLVDVLQAVNTHLALGWAWLKKQKHCEVLLSVYIHVLFRYGKYSCGFNNSVKFICVFFGNPVKGNIFSNPNLC
jgi:hypothetical protein